MNRLPSISIFLVVVLLGVFGPPQALADNFEREKIIDLTEMDPMGPFHALVDRNPHIFTLFVDGTLIYRGAMSQDGAHYQWTKVSSDEIKKLTFSLPSLLDLNDRYNLSNYTCQPINRLSIRVGAKTKSITLYGNLFVRNHQTLRRGVPEPLLTVLDRLVSFEHAGAQTGLPRDVSSEKK